MNRVAALLIPDLIFALVGWTMVVLTSRFERGHRQRNAEKFGEHEPGPRSRRRGVVLFASARDRAPGATSSALTLRPRLAKQLGQLKIRPSV